MLSGGLETEVECAEAETMQYEKKYFNIVK